MQNHANSNSHVVVLVREYVEQLTAIRYSPKTVNLYRRALLDFAGAVGKDDPRAITLQDLEKYRALLLERGFKAASVVSYIQAVRQFFKRLEEHQHIFANPAADLAPMKLPHEIQPLPTEDEMLIMLNQPDVTTPIGIRDRAMLETVYSSGVRRQELLDMTVSCLNLEAGRARILGKGQRERMVPLGLEAVRWLRLYVKQVRAALAKKESGDALWLAREGAPVEYGALQQIVRRHGKVPGITTRIGLHSIRRACATHMLSHGASPATIQLLLGHSDMRHLSQYLRVAMSDLKKAHEESRLGQ